MHKVVIVSVPFVDDPSPLAAPAVLKAALQRNNIECVGMDLNVDIYNKIDNHPKRHLFLQFFYRQNIADEIVDDLVEMLEFYADEILKHQPTIVGLSLFCNTSQTFTPWLCALLKQQNPDVKIVIGGPGLQTLENNLIKYPDRLKSIGLIDDYITGDGEQSFVEYVKGNLDFPGINSYSWQPVKDFNSLPMPDYSDYQFFRYKYKLLPIVDSRGCVQNCEFCDVIAFWNKFQYLTAQEIYNRMQFYIDCYGVYRFQFASSICNGNLKEFRKLVKLIADYNENTTTVESQIHWVGSFIIRKKTHHTEELFDYIKKSNGTLLTGVESVVESVRINLGKKFTNADLDHHMVMIEKFQIPTVLLLIGSYPTETESDFEYVKQWFIDNKQYANNPISKVQIAGLAVLPGTKLESRVKQGFTIDHETIRKRSRELYQVIEKCGFEIHQFE